MSAVYQERIRDVDDFVEADEVFAALKADLLSDSWSELGHGELERRVRTGGWELLRSLLQSHYTLRARREPLEPVVGADGRRRAHVRPGKSRTMKTVFGPIRVERTGYRGRGVSELHPVDASLNLPSHTYSHELERQAVLSSIEMSFEAAIEALRRTTASAVGKRTVEVLMQRAAIDFESFYELQEWTEETLKDTGELLIISVDQKGVVMVPDDLTPETRRVAERQRTTLRAIDNRDGKDHASGRKRMATVATVYTIQPDERDAADIVQGLRRLKDSSLRSRRTVRPELKRLWASLEHEPQVTVDEAFAEARKRDPRGEKKWIVLVDGDQDLERWVKRAAKRHGAKIVLALDLIHALQYLWRAGKALQQVGGTKLEDWVLERVERLLRGKVSDVVAGMRRAATKLGLIADKRKEVDLCANYFLRRKRMMCYDKLLAWGAPIATGVIEGGCRHLIQIRLERAGAKWTLRGAEAMMRLRAIAISGDFDEYWCYHEQQEFSRNHAAAYADQMPPPVAPTSDGKPWLRVVR